MIAAITGLPGSGKSLLAVSFAEKLFISDPDIILYHNVEGYEKGEKLEDHQFTASYNDSLPDDIKGKKKILIFDECQKKIGSHILKAKLHDVFLFFDTHRHYNYDVYLITQHMSKIQATVRYLVELEYRCKPKTRRLLSKFRYDEYSSGTFVCTHTLRSYKHLYSLYSSSATGKHTDYSRAIFKLIPHFAITIIVIFLIGTYLNTHIPIFRAFGIGKSNNKNKDNVSSGVDGKKSHMAIKNVKVVKPHQIIEVSFFKINDMIYYLYGEVYLRPDQFPFSVFRVGNRFFYYDSERTEKMDKDDKEEKNKNDKEV